MLGASRPENTSSAARARTDGKWPTKQQRHGLLLWLVRDQGTVGFAEHRADFRPRHFQMTGVQDDRFRLGSDLQFDGDGAGKPTRLGSVLRIDVVRKVDERGSGVGTRGRS